MSWALKGGKREGDILGVRYRSSKGLESGCNSKCRPERPGEALAGWLNG